MVSPDREWYSEPVQRHHESDSGGRRRGGPAPLVPRAEHEYIDFHNLLKINGVWKITNTTATHSSRTAPLKPRFEAD